MKGRELCPAHVRFDYCVNDNNKYGEYVPSEWCRFSEAYIRKTMNAQRKVLPAIFYLGGVQLNDNI